MYKVIIPVDDTTAKVEYFEKPKYVFKQTNGVIITTDDASKADGILCYDNSVIYAFKDKQLDTEDSEYQICYMYEIDMNTYIKEMDDIKKQQESSISSNSTQITEAQTALVDIFESSLNTGVEVESLSEQMTESQTALVDVFESTLENSTNIDNLDTSNDSNNSDSKSYLAYNIYLNKNDIATYEFVLNDSENNYSIAYNKKENSFSIKENDKETFKGVISTKDNATTITLTSDNTNIGTITISENNISANIIFDEATNTALTVNINSLTSENTTTTTADIAISSSGTNIDILSLTDIKTITDNVANFDNIDTTNSIDINNLTETDMTTIQNNLMIVLYSFMGITM